ncbi:MAG: hypothetical protein R6U67_01240, partial [Sodalinema sp.]|uniref:hypothetical protein n=1 Tax=Sodalinema sp. TaxID=3080550 RepID=UPI00396F3350
GLWAALPPVFGRQSLPKGMTWPEPSHEEIEENAVTASPLRGTLRAILMTILVVGVVWGLKQLRWRWRV